MEKIDLSKLTKNFEYKWVAISPDYKRIISSGKSLREVADKIKEKDKNKVVFHKVIPAGYAPLSL